MCSVPNTHLGVVECILAWHSYVMIVQIIQPLIQLDTTLKNVWQELSHRESRPHFIGQPLKVNNFIFNALDKNCIRETPRPMMINYLDLLFALMAGAIVCGVWSSLVMLGNPPFLTLVFTFLLAWVLVGHNSANPFEGCQSCGHSSKM